METNPLSASSLHDSNRDSDSAMVPKSEREVVDPAVGGTNSRPPLHTLHSCPFVLIRGKKTVSLPEGFSELTHPPRCAGVAPWFKTVSWSSSEAEIQRN